MSINDLPYIPKPATYPGSFIYTNLTRLKKKAKRANVVLPEDVLETDIKSDREAIIFCGVVIGIFLS